MTHTKHAGIERTWTVELNGKHYARFFVWRDVESMYAGVSDKSQAEDYIGRCFTFGYIHGNAEFEPNKASKKYAEVHVVKGEYGVAVVAHEIQHLMNYWVQFARWYVDSHDEMIAHLCGEINRQFWVEHYLMIEKEVA
jgi:hypothetical protein